MTMIFKILNKVLNVNYANTVEPRFYAIEGSEKSRKNRGQF